MQKRGILGTLVRCTRIMYRVFRFIVRTFAYLSVRPYNLHNCLSRQREKAAYGRNDFIRFIHVLSVVSFVRGEHRNSATTRERKVNLVNSALIEKFAHRFKTLDSHNMEIVCCSFKQILYLEALISCTYIRHTIVLACLLFSSPFSIYFHFYDVILNNIFNGKFYNIYNRRSFAAITCVADILMYSDEINSFF